MASSRSNPTLRFPDSIRRRSKRACETCRRRKTKCDGQLPCRNCRQWEFDCTYEEQLPALSGSQSSTARSSAPPVPTTQPLGTETAATSASDTFYEPSKHRYYGASSAVSFPRALAVSLDATAPPRIHSFAYNCGVVDEHFFRESSANLRGLIERGLAEQYVRRYVEVLNPVLCWSIEPNLDAIWSGTGTSEAEMLACFVILLGAFFSWPLKFDGHTAILHHGQDLLDRSNFHDAPSLLQIEHAEAWILRTLYLRCITRPNITWISSSITMNVVESLGLHRELDSLGNLNLNTPDVSEDETDLRRKVFWTALAINRLFSFEIGRSPSVIFTANTKLPVESNAFIIAQQVLYSQGEHAIHSEPEAILSKIAQVEAGPPLTSILIADVACGVFRELHRRVPRISEQVLRQLNAVFGRGLDACRQLCEDQQPWWFLTSMPFQFICIAVASGKQIILERAPEAMAVLEQVSRTMSTHMTREACSTARQLLQASVESRDRELNIIREALGSSGDRLDLPSLAIEEQDWGLFSGSQLDP